MYNVWEIHDWFKKWGEYKGQNIQKLKMMKLLFYAQAQHIKLYKEPLFNDSDGKIEAWKLGPVVPKVREKYQESMTLDASTDFSWDNYSEETSDFLVKLWNTYGKMDDSLLVESSHNESIWFENYEKDKNNEITVDRLIEYYA